MGGKFLIGVTAVIIGLVLGALAKDAVAGGVGGATSATQTLVVLGRQPETQYIDLRKRGDSQGDLRVANWKLFSPSGTAQVGERYAVCTITDPVDEAGEVREATQCQVTYKLAGGDIMAQALTLRNNLHTLPGSSPMAIIGGTGLYAGIGGEITFLPLSARETRDTFRIMR
jgi:hypothetical protein